MQDPRSEGKKFWWFTFGVAHPLANMVQGVFASDENSARDVMCVFYGDRWCCQYAFQPKDCVAKEVRIGCYTYRPIDRILFEGDRYR